MQISKNFTLEEFLISQTAARNGIDMTPSLEIKDNIIKLVEIVLQPLRTELGHSLILTSGFRPEELNTLIGGSKTSAHRFGCAADVHSNRIGPLELSKLAQSMDLLYDQVIHEFGVWVHLGITWNLKMARNEELTAYKDSNKKTIYVPGLHAIADLI